MSTVLFRVLGLVLFFLVYGVEVERSSAIGFCHASNAHSLDMMYTAHTIFDRKAAPAALISKMGDPLSNFLQTLQLVMLSCPAGLLLPFLIARNRLEQLKKELKKELEKNLKIYHLCNNECRS